MTARTTTTYYATLAGLLAWLTITHPTGVTACVAGLWHIVGLTWWMVLLLAGLCGIACMAAVMRGPR